MDDCTQVASGRLKTFKHKSVAQYQWGGAQQHCPKICLSPLCQKLFYHFKQHCCVPPPKARHSLAALTGVDGGRVAVRPAPAGSAVAHRPGGTIGLADAVQAVQLAAWFTAGQHARLHLRLGEVLQLVVDVEAADAALEAGAVLQLPEPEGSRVHVHGHACGGCQRAI